MAAIGKLRADAVAEAVFKALGIEIPDQLCGFNLNVVYGKEPTLTMTVIPQPAQATPDGEIIKEEKKFRLEPIEEPVNADLEPLRARLEKIYSGSPQAKAIMLDRMIQDIKPLSMTPSEMDFVRSANLYKRPGEIVTCSEKYFPRDHADSICKCGAKINDHLCLCGCGKKCGETPEHSHCVICGDHYRLGVQHICKTANIEQRNPAVLADMARPPQHISDNRCILPKGMSVSQVEIASFGIVKSPTNPDCVERASCPDCYVGLSGQIEKCERHR